MYLLYNSNKEVIEMLPEWLQEIVKALEEIECYETAKAMIKVWREF